MKVLLTSGGGAKGAFSVGAIQYILKNAVSSFDLISGTSTGSTIAMMIAGDRVDDMVDIYLNTRNNQVLQPINLVDAINEGKPYVYDTEPLLGQLNTYLDQPTYDHIMASETLVCFNSVCLQTGQITVFSTKNITSSPLYDHVTINNLESMKNAILGSTNQAVFMNPITINDLQYVDGGNRQVIPSKVVLSNLMDEDHDIYILSNNPHTIQPVNTIYKNILEVLLRAISIFIQEERENNLQALVNFKQTSKKKIRLFYIKPDGELDKQFPTGLRFDKTKMNTWMALGRDQAKKVLTSSPDGNWALVV